MLKDALRKCESANSSIQHQEQACSPSDHVLHDFEERPGCSTMLGQLNSNIPAIGSCLDSHQIVQGVEEPNANGPTHDYYCAQPMKHGMGMYTKS